MAASSFSLHSGASPYSTAIAQPIPGIEAEEAATMDRLFKPAILSAVVAATAFAAVPAQAEHRHRHVRQPVVYNDAANLVGAAILGLAAGAIVAGIVSSNQQAQAIEANPYRHPRPRPDRDYFPPAPQRMDYAYGAGYAAPWSREWYRYCTMRYRSFDPASGTYITYRGEERFCVAE